MTSAAPSRRWLSTAVLLVLASSSLHGAVLGAPNPGWTAVEFSLKPQNAAAPAWTVRLDASGSGSYSEVGATGPASTPLRVSASTLERIERGLHAVRHDRCETHLKNIAHTGEKTILYRAANGVLTCAFNYSDDAGLMDTAAAFQSIAATMQVGERLRHEERYDRLALDAEMDELVSAIRDGTAIEAGNIAPILQELVADDYVIDRVRRKAARLLQDPGSITSATGADLSAR